MVPGAEGVSVAPSRYLEDASPAIEKMTMGDAYPPSELADTIRQIDAVRMPATQLEVIAACDRQELWRQDGATSMSAWLAMLCGHHHRLAHEGDWRIDGRPSGHFRFTRYDGMTLIPGLHGLRSDVRRRLVTLLIVGPPEVVDTG